MAFPKSIKEKALVNSRRCCCICHKFAGLYTNVHHIKPKSKKGPDTLANAIVLCLQCHGEVGHYNSKHPIGNKYSRDELIKHRDHWCEWCKNNPYAPLPDCPIIISPQEIVLGSEDWETVLQLNLFNKTDAFLYQVWIKINIKSESITPHDIPLSSQIDSENYKLKIKNIEINPAIYTVHALDQNNEKTSFIVLDCIKPKRDYNVKITIDPIDKSGVNDILSFFVSSFSTTPNIKRTKKHKRTAAFSFTPPENITVKSVSLLLRKARN